MVVDFYNSNEWIIFILAFSLIAEILWAYYYIGIYMYQDTKWRKRYEGKVALIVPCFNEDLNKLSDSIYHALKADGINQYLFVDDGSKNGVKRVFDFYRNIALPVGKKASFISLPENKGKRYAQGVGILNSDEDTDIFVCMDSDTILNKDSVIKLTAPFNHAKIGGTTACILVKNQTKNFLTRCLSAMYWSASKIWRKGQDRYGFQGVTNGQLSAYRAPIMKKMLDEYIHQEFLGSRCTLSDDRYLTHRIQTDYDKEIRFIDDCGVFTYVPETYWQTMKMFIRWKRGSSREALLVLKNIFKHPILVFDVWINHAIQIMQTIVRISVIVLAILYSPVVLFYYIMIILLISLLFAYDMIWKKPSLIFFRLCYSIMNEIFLGWSHIIGWLTIHKQETWSTR